MDYVWLLKVVHGGIFVAAVFYLLLRPDSVQRNALKYVGRGSRGLASSLAKDFVQSPFYQSMVRSLGGMCVVMGLVGTIWSLWPKD